MNGLFLCRKLLTEAWDRRLVDEGTLRSLYELLGEINEEIAKKEAKGQIREGCKGNCKK